MIAMVADHVWQSTLVAGVVWLLMLALRKNRAHLRYQLWLAASVKFLVPCAVLVAVGSQVGWRPSTIARLELTRFIDAFSQPFSTVTTPDLRPRGGASSSPTSTVKQTVSAVLWATWFSGCAAVLLTWSARWRRVAEAVRKATPVADGHELATLRRVEQRAGIKRPIALVSSDTPLEPGVFGILKPVLLWPRTIAGHLDDRQVEAILAHEVAHVRRHDNLAAAVHMVVEAVFWFHPLVWWIGTRLVDERERACDAEVVRLGSDPQVYAESILKTCQFYVESPLVCVAGVTGADLQKRIEQIMKNDAGATLSASRKLLLATIAAVTIVGPLALGMMQVPPLAAQSPPALAIGPAFADVSIKANASANPKFSARMDGGEFAVTHATLRFLIVNAYRIGPFQIAGGPNWLDSDHFDIVAKAADNPPKDQMWSMVRRLLADRFKLTVHNETRDVPVYALVLARSDGTLGPNIRRSACAGKDDTPPASRSFDPPTMPQLPCGASGTRPTGIMQARWQTMAEFAEHTLPAVVGRRVRDRTGLTGYFDLDVDFTPQPMPPRPSVPPAPAYGRMAPFLGPAFFTAVEEQLGLRMDSQTGPVDFLVIDRAERPKLD